MNEKIYKCRQVEQDFTKSVLRTWTGPNATKENAITGFIGEFGEALEMDHRISKDGEYINTSIERMHEELGDFLYYYHALCFFYDVKIKYPKEGPEHIGLHVAVIGSFVYACNIVDLVKKNIFHGKSNEEDIRNELRSVPEKMLYPNDMGLLAITGAMTVNTRKIDWYAAKIEISTCVGQFSSCPRCGGLMPSGNMYFEDACCQGCFYAKVKG